MTCRCGSDNWRTVSESIIYGLGTVAIPVATICAECGREHNEGKSCGICGDVAQLTDAIQGDKELKVCGSCLEEFKQCAHCNEHVALDEFRSGSNVCGVCVQTMVREVSA